MRKRQLLYTDPAYAEVKRNMVYFELINAVVNGGDMKSSESLSFAHQMLSEAENSFQYLATQLDNTIILSYKETCRSVQKLAAIGWALPGSGIGGILTILDDWGL
ncbi:hypothetical protein N0V84_000631 [Fusarium piperis]|uniref:Uncharacterized protein n=1 Tax=Fusarium piperis TaxID=1435070 RepID=A0A9W8WMC0_9HYPO|nr:hypothetical protein N0V84_000631 [Fusarium piperis]